jgi:hypothetical protein
MKSATKPQQQRRFKYATGAFSEKSRFRKELRQDIICTSEIYNLQI